jgi:hypothetical protein
MPRKAANGVSGLGQARDKASADIARRARNQYRQFTERQSFWSCAHGDVEGCG